MSTICLFKNGIGNLLMQLPAIQALASMDSIGKVDYCLDSNWSDSRIVGVKDLLENCAFVNKIYSYPSDSIPKNYDLWFYTPHTEYSQAYEFFKQQGKLLEIRVDWRKTMLHETEYYMQVVRKLGYNGPTPKKYCPVSNDESLKLEKGHKKKVGLCNGYFHTQSWDKKAWPYFKALSEYLERYFEVDIVLIGIEKELSEVNRKYVKHDYVGKLTLTQTAQIISQLDLLITTDTSCMHVADALNIPLIALFGGTFIFKSGPLGRNSHVLTSQIRCRPCQSSELFTECKVYDCMNKITPGIVINEIERLRLLCKD